MPEGGDYSDSDSLRVLPSGPNVQSVEQIRMTKLRGNRADLCDETGAIPLIYTS